MSLLSTAARAIGVPLTLVTPGNAGPYQRRSTCGVAAQPDDLSNSQADVMSGVRQTALGSAAGRPDLDTYQEAVRVEVQHDFTSALPLHDDVRSRATVRHGIRRRVPRRCPSRIFMSSMAFAVLLPARLPLYSPHLRSAAN